MLDSYFPRKCHPRREVLVSRLCLHSDEKKEEAEEEEDYVYDVYWQNRRCSLEDDFHYCDPTNVENWKTANRGGHLEGVCVVSCWPMRLQRILAHGELLHQEMRVDYCYVGWYHLEEDILPWKYGENHSWLTRTIQRKKVAFDKHKMARKVVVGCMVHHGEENTR